VIEGGGELVESWDALSMGGNQVVDGDVKDVRSLMQTVLRFACFHLSGDWRETGQCRQKKPQISAAKTSDKKSGQEFLPASAASTAKMAESCFLSV
jgi:hypothetical protein